MATKNPRVVGYIQPDTHVKLKQYMEANGLTESKALDVILSEYFGVEVPRIAPSNTPDIDSRIEKAIAPLAERLAVSIANLEARMDELGKNKEDLVDQLASVGEARLMGKSQRAA